MKKRKNKQLKIYDRDRIEALLNSGHKQSEIFKVLKRDKGTISREIKRGSKKLKNGKTIYIAEYAQKKARDRERGAKYQWSKINQDKDLRKFIEDELKDFQSPETISGRMVELKKPFYASKTAIYKWLDTSQGNSCQQYLYSARNWTVGRKKNKKKNTPKKEMIPNRVSIHERSDISNEYGHWEADTIVSGKKTRSKASLAVAVERKSMKLVIQKIPNLKPDNFANAMINVKKEHNIKSLTLDNGIENRYHEKIKVPTYFCDPYSSWQKGKVEEVNKMIRWFIPKGSDISLYNDKYIKAVERILNSKYRKSLGYKNPYEVMAENEKIKKYQPKMSVNILLPIRKRVAFEG